MSKLLPSFRLMPNAPAIIDGVADGYEAFVLARVVEETKGPVLFVLRDGQRMGDFEQVLGFIEPLAAGSEVSGLGLPAL